MKAFFLAICMVLTVTCMAKTVNACDVQCPVTEQNAWGYHQADHFSWQHSDDQVHLLVGFSGSLLIGELVQHYAKLPVWQSALIGTIIIGLAGTAKEVLFDTYTSRTDISCYWAGALVGGLTVLVIHF